MLTTSKKTRDHTTPIIQPQHGKYYEHFHDPYSGKVWDLTLLWEFFVDVFDYQTQVYTYAIDACIENVNTIRSIQPSARMNRLAEFFAEQLELFRQYFSEITATPSDEKPIINPAEYSELSRWHVLCHKSKHSRYRLDYRGFFKLMHEKYDSDPKKVMEFVHDSYAILIMFMNKSNRDLMLHTSLNKTLHSIKEIINSVKIYDMEFDLNVEYFKNGYCYIPEWDQWANKVFDVDEQAEYLGKDQVESFTIDSLNYLNEIEQVS